MTPCKSCQEGYNPLIRREELKRDGLTLQNHELQYCRVCADELFRGVIRPLKARRARQFTSYANSLKNRCPLVEDMSPSQENALRNAEDK